MAPNIESNIEDGLFHNNQNHSNKRTNTISLTELVDKLPGAIRFRKEGICCAAGDADPISDLFEHLELKRHDWKPYEFFDPVKNYTRNLIATDHQTFTLLLLCWNPDRESPIHDHPCDGCWMKVCSGNIQELIYREEETNNSAKSIVPNNTKATAEASTTRTTTTKAEEREHNTEAENTKSKLDNNKETHKTLKCIQSKIYNEGQLAFIEDSMGYHKIINVSKCQKAITLHLYSPPIQSCNVWCDEECVTPMKSNMCFHSNNGKQISTKTA